MTRENLYKKKNRAALKKYQLSLKKKLKGELISDHEGKVVSNRRQRREKKARENNNRNTVSLNVVYLGKGKFWKSYRRIQVIEPNILFDTDLKKRVLTPRKVITHHVSK